MATFPGQPGAPVATEDSIGRLRLAAVDILEHLHSQDRSLTTAGLGKHLELLLRTVKRRETTSPSSGALLIGLPLEVGVRIASSLSLPHVIHLAMCCTTTRDWAFLDLMGRTHVTAVDLVGCTRALGMGRRGSRPWDPWSPGLNWLMHRCPSIRTLDLGNGHDTAAVQPYGPVVLPTNGRLFPKLKVVNLSLSVGVAATWLEELLRATTGLKMFIGRYTGLTDECLEVLAFYCPRLVGLDVSFTGVTGLGVNRVVRACQELRYLALEHCTSIIDLFLGFQGEFPSPPI